MTQIPLTSTSPDHSTLCADPATSRHHVGENYVLPAEEFENVEKLIGADQCRRLGIFRLPTNFVLSVVIPCFNEAKTIEQIIQRVRGTAHSQ